MFIRKKTCNDQVFYQVVEGRREPFTGKVRQRIVVTLGKDARIGAAVKTRKRYLAQLKRRRAVWPEAPDPAVYPRTTIDRIKRLDRMIALEIDRIERLKEADRTMKAQAKGAVVLEMKQSGTGTRGRAKGD